MQTSLCFALGKVGFFLSPVVSLTFAGDPQGPGSVLRGLTGQRNQGVVFSEKKGWSLGAFRTTVSAEHWQGQKPFRWQENEPVLKGFFFRFLY